MGNLHIGPYVACFKVLAVEDVTTRSRPASGMRHRSGSEAESLRNSKCFAGLPRRESPIWALMTAIGRRER
jgi:hypothetical protein